MITMAIAVKEPSVTRRYRHMLAQAGFETHFVSNVPELIRTVKARPVDVILFDLGPSAISPVDWLAAATKDKDLEFTPVLWIGTKVPAPLQPVIQEYRPGIWLKNIPLTDELISTVLQLIGRKKDESTVEKKPASTDREWTPEANIIEDALQIFDEGKPSRHTKSTVAPELLNQEASLSKESVTEGPAPSARQARLSDLSLPDDSIEIDTMELGRTAGPSRVSASKKTSPPQTVQTVAPSAVRDTAVLGGSTDEEIARITDLVVERLSRALASTIDRDMIRREIEAALEDVDR